MKTLLSFALLVGVVAALLYFLMGYQVVRSERGYNVLKKKDWELTKPVIDTRDWKLKDFLENSDISKALADLDWKDIKEGARDGWQELSRRVENATDDIDWNATSEKMRQDLAAVKKEAKQKYDALVRRFENKEFDGDQFRQGIRQLEDWVDRQVKRIKSERN